MARTVKFLNNLGGGFADDVTIEKGESVVGFVQRQVSEQLGIPTSEVDTKNYHIRVNREIVTEAQLLKAGDRVTLTPLKVQGA